MLLKVELFQNENENLKASIQNCSITENQYDLWHYGEQFEIANFANRHTQMIELYSINAIRLFI